MAYNGSGTFLINTAGQPVVAGTVISSTTFNSLTADLATGLSTVITKDGQTTVTANIPMASFKFTGLGVGSAAGDSANLSQVQSTVTKLLTSVSGTDTITAVGAPVVAAYAAGQMFYFVATGDNTTSVTINIDGLGAKAVTRDGSVALVAGDIKSGEVVVVVYDGTRFQVVSQLNSAGNATFANVSITSALNVGGVATFSAGTAAAPSITTTGDTNTGIFFPAADTIAFTEGGVESFRISSSGNAGLGTTSPTSAANYTALTINNATNGGQLRLENNGSLASSIAVDASNVYISAESTRPFRFFNNNAETMRLDSSGILGLGVTPPAWGTLKAIDISTTGGVSGSNGASIVNQNAYFNGTNWIYKASSLTAQKYEQSSGVHRWDIAASGTAGNAITFTQAMTLTAAGELLVGTTSANTFSGYSTFQLGQSTSGSIINFQGGATSTSSAAHIRLDCSATTVSSLTIETRNQAGTASTPIVFKTQETERVRITAAGELVVGSNTSAYTSAGRGVIEVNGSSSSLYGFRTGGTARGYLLHGGTDLTISNDANGPMVFLTNASEKARITTTGAFCVGTTSGAPGGVNVVGIALGGGGYVSATRDSDISAEFNRKTNDGAIVKFLQDANEEGSISVSGGTVSYNAFAGSHWSQLQDGSKPDILRGTVMESINELCVWPDEQNERLPKSKVSDTAGSKKVYGVFMAWDNDWTTTNDMYITAVGAFICRVNASVTVQEGDLLESNGDGTARVQADDIIRSSTIGKVTSTVKTHQYDDGSYCVPTVLYCG